jgi:hypothetical protein
MEPWWEIGLPDAHAPALVREVAYYRHSAQDRQENSIPIQQDQVRAWAKQHGVEIIHASLDRSTRPFKSCSMVNEAKLAMLSRIRSVVMFLKHWPTPIF